MNELQIIWFILIAVLLTGYAVLDGFDLGTGVWYLFTNKEEERVAIQKSIGPFWDGNEVWILTGGGAIFAAFPPVYASVFSGFYIALMLLLLGLILRAVAIEFRKHVISANWIACWDRAFAFGSIIPALLLGVALGNVVRGLPLDSAGNYLGGFFELLNPYSLIAGLMGLAMFAMHGALYLVMKTSGALMQKAKKWALNAWIVYLGLFVVTATWTLVSYQHENTAISFLFGIIALMAIIGVRFFLRSSIGMAFISSSLSIASLIAFTGSSLFPYLVPASNNSEGLTIYNSSSTQNTLTVMLVVALVGMPLVLGYTIYVYRVFRGKVS